VVFLRDHKVDCVTVGMRIEVQFSSVLNELWFHV